MIKIITSKRLCSILPFMLVAILGLFVQSSLVIASVDAEKKSFKDSVRIAYVPHRAFLVDNGIASGALAPLMECAISYFQNVEYVEMASYERMMMSLETNIVDIGINMVQTKKRDKLAAYALDLYRSRILMVTRIESTSDTNISLGVIGARRGTEMIDLLAVKGIDVDMKVKTIDHLFNMFLKKYIDSFAETEISIIDRLHALDAGGVDYDYSVLSEHAGGAYLAFDFEKKFQSVPEEWGKHASSCAYLAPTLDN